MFLLAKDFTLNTLVVNLFILRTCNISFLCYYFRDTLLPKDFSLSTMVDKFESFRRHEEEACLVLGAPVSEENVSKVCSTIHIVLPFTAACEEGNI